MKPHLVKIIEDGGTRARTLTVAKESGRIPLKQENIDIIKRAMVGVIADQSGTGFLPFRNAGYTAGGKTGTAQVVGLRGGKYNAAATPERLRDNALFTAFAPADQPKIAIAVVVENARLRRGDCRAHRAQGARLLPAGQAPGRQDQGRRVPQEDRRRAARCESPAGVTSDFKPGGETPGNKE